jgi:hypothetical protein
MTYICLIPTHLVPHPTHFPCLLPFLAYLPPLPPFVVTFQAPHVKFAEVSFSSLHSNSFTSRSLCVKVKLKA